MAKREPYAKDDESGRLGFQRSETSGCDVQLFSHQTDPVLVSEAKTDFAGKARKDVPTIISATTSKSIGGGPGTFTLEVKCSTKKADDMMRGFQDDDWVDITFTRHARKWHVLRGLVDSIRETDNIGGTGATSRVYTITGSSFERIWACTPLWYDLQSAKPEGLTADSELNAFGKENLSGLTPAKLIEGFLFNLFKEQLQKGRGTWSLPKGMKGNVKEFFIDSVQKLFTGYLTGINDGMKRISAGLGSLAALQGNYFLDFVTEYGDPPFCEMIFDVYPDGAFPQPGDEAPPEKSSMVVMFRDRPFLTVDPDIISDFSAWNDLPVFVVPRAQLSNGVNLTRSGSERYNSFQAVSIMVQEAYNASANLAAKPLWDLNDIALHGLRRYDVTSRFMALNSDDQVQNRTNRAITRDWYCMNPYFRSGQMPLALGRPDIRIGSRVRVPGVKSPDQDFDAYVEQVEHSWRFGQGMRTTLGVTRGWYGGDKDFKEKLQKVSGSYSSAGNY